MTESLWSLSNVSLSGNSRPRLQELTVTITSGKTALVGPSGSGKTSLLNLLVGFEKPSQGTITRQFSKSNPSVDLYWVPHSLGLWPHLTVCQHLQTVYPKELGAAVFTVEELLKRFDLESLRDIRPDYLSQGERSRLAVARALAAHPTVLVMDEPLVHVNPTHAGRYWQTVREYQQVSGCHFVFSTHSPEIALRESEQVLCLKSGQIIYSGRTEELYHSPPNEELASYLGATNWFEADEAEHWLQAESSTAIHYRPEQLELVHEEEAPFEVTHSYFVGQYSETEIIDPLTEQRRRVLSRPIESSKPLKAGQKVFIRCLLLLLLLVGLSGCDSSATARMDVQHERYWMLPTHDKGLPAPRGLAISQEQELLVLDNAGRVLVYSPERELLRQWWMPDYDVGKPEGVVQLNDGRIVVADTHYHRIVFFNAEGEFVNSIGSLGEEPGQFIYPVAITQDDSQNIYVCEYGGNDRIQKFDQDGNLLLAFGSFGMEPDQFQRPSGITWHDGKIYVADAINNRIQIFSDQGEHLDTWGSLEHPLELDYPYDIEVGPQGHFYIAEYGSGQVTELNPQGELVSQYGTTGGGSEQFNTPWGITVDAARNVYVADTGNRRVVQLQKE